MESARRSDPSEILQLSAAAGYFQYPPYLCRELEKTVAHPEGMLRQMVSKGNIGPWYKLIRRTLEGYLSPISLLLLDLRKGGPIPLSLHYCSSEYPFCSLLRHIQMVHFRKSLQLILAK